MKTRLLLPLLLLTSCAVGQDYQLPELSLPKSWISSAKPADDKAALEREWWKRFGDPTLDALIAKASDNNLDIKIAQSRMNQARAGVSAARAALLPTGNVQANGERQANRIAFPGPIDLTKPFNTFQAGFDASWELDLFGGHRRDLEAQNATFEVSEADLNDVRVSMLAEVARGYVNIRQYQSQLAIAQNAAGADAKALDITKQRAKAGEAAGVEVSRANATAERSQAEIPYYQNLLSQSELAMDVLTGQQPGATHELVKDAKPIPTWNGELVLATPSAVIANRPDIRVAERSLAAATAQRGSALAKFFPDISLSGFFGLLNVKSNELLQSSSKSWDVGGGVLLPILNYGTLSANLDVADAKQQESLLTYQKNVIAALADVEQSLEAYQQGKEHSGLLTKTADDDQHAVDVAALRHKQGATSLIEVLDAERTLYAAQQEQAEATAQNAADLIAVYKSFGGI